MQDAENRMKVLIRKPGFDKIWNLQRHLLCALETSGTMSNPLLQQYFGFTDTAWTVLVGFAL